MRRFKSLVLQVRGLWAMPTSRKGVLIGNQVIRALVCVQNTQPRLKKPHAAILGAKNVIRLLEQPILMGRIP
ncbi:hypothetical protein P692DRAFT_20831683 [Suillus brevipes Sb2]|nr:hypothetical protein P692DRAFT_20831683 [Suillus brevipes Sb2]